MDAIGRLVVDTALRPVERLLFQMLPWYDKYMYGPLSDTLSPHLAKVPRYATVGGKQYTVFTANIVSYGRATLVVLAAALLKYQYSFFAAMVVFLHDFLDHVDGMVAREQRKKYGSIDDPVYGGFMDAFCDKIFNCLCLWSLMLTVDTGNMGTIQLAFFLGATFSIFVYEFVLGLVRTQDYFHAHYCKVFGDLEGAGEVKISANMSGKLKEKLESFGIAFLCLASSSSNLMYRPDGLVGITMLLLSLRLAHSSLAHKLARRQKSSSVPRPSRQRQGSASVPPYHRTVSSPPSSCDESPAPSSSDEEKYDVFVITQNQGAAAEILQFGEDEVVDKVYTIGCFDLFHFGHEKLLKRMRRLGKRLIVGVHSSDSITTLKDRVPIDSLETRMENVRKHAHQAFCIDSTDPSTFIQCIVNLLPGEKALYVRGNDMVNFPARDVVEQLMPVRFLPYTQGVSSTMLRKRLLAKQPIGSETRANGRPSVPSGGQVETKELH